VTLIDGITKGELSGVATNPVLAVVGFQARLRLFDKPGDSEHPIRDTHIQVLFGHSREIGYIRWKSFRLRKTPLLSTDPSA
jgi:hypothetical protein